MPQEASVSDITVALGDLTIRATRSTSAASSTSPASTVRGAPPVKAKARPAAKRASTQRVRFYVVTRAPPSHEGIVGIHYTTWARVAEALPTGALIGSGCHCKAFDSESEAADYWVQEGWELPAPFFD